MSKRKKGTKKDVRKQPKGVSRPMPTPSYQGGTISPVVSVSDASQLEQSDWLLFLREGFEALPNGAEKVRKIISAIEQESK
jgi:hypothetical protein